MFRENENNLVDEGDRLIWIIEHIDRDIGEEGW
jgi:hypothetical protein